jgi:hypothetical protein
LTTKNYTYQISAFVSARFARKGLEMKKIIIFVIFLAIVSSAGISLAGEIIRESWDQSVRDLGTGKLTPTYKGEWVKSVNGVPPRSGEKGMGEDGQEYHWVPANQSPESVRSSNHDTDVNANISNLERIINTRVAERNKAIAERNKAIVEREKAKREASKLDKAFGTEKEAHQKTTGLLKKTGAERDNLQNWIRDFYEPQIETVTGERNNLQSWAGDYYEPEIKKAHEENLRLWEAIVAWHNTLRTSLAENLGLEKHNKYLWWGIYALAFTTLLSGGVILFFFGRAIWNFLKGFFRK